MNYALLVGINVYKSEKISNLRGCENDVDAIEEFLLGWFSPSGISIQTLKSQEAERKEIIRGFEQHLSLAQQGDTAIFYFSGHGTREPSPIEFQAFQSDGFHEALVCHDSESGGYDLADKEIKVLVANLAARGVEVVTIVDSCHSGSITRDKLEAEDRYRLDTSDRTEVRPRSAWYPGTFESLATPPAPHLALSACDYKELSRERRLGIPEQPRGIFTYSLIDVCQQPGGKFASYSVLMSTLRIRLHTLVFDKKQTPQLEAPGRANPHKPFLGSEGTRSLPLSRHRLSQVNGRWVFPMGKVHGISPADQTDLTLYVDGDENPVSGAYLFKVDLLESEVDLPPGLHLRSHNVVYAELQGPIGTPMPVYLSDEDRAAFERLIATGSHAKPEFIPAVLSGFHLTNDPSQAEVGVVFQADRFRLIHPETMNDLVPDISANSTVSPVWYSDPALVTEALLHLRRTWMIKHLSPTAAPDEAPFDALYPVLKVKGQTWMGNQEGTEFTIDVSQRENFAAAYQFLAAQRGDSLISCKPFYLSRHQEIFELPDLEIPGDDSPRSGMPRSFPCQSMIRLTCVRSRRYFCCY